MAVSNLNKARVYDFLGRLNASFSRINRHLAELETVRIFNPAKVKDIGRQSRELQANANFHLLETLHDFEQRDWARFGKTRRKSN